MWEIPRKNVKFCCVWIFWNYELSHMGQRKKVIFKLFLDMELKEVIVFGYQGDVISSGPMCVLSVNDNYIICCVRL